MDARRSSLISQRLAARKSNHLDQVVSNHRNMIDRMTSQNANYTQAITNNLNQMRSERESLNIAKAASENNTFAEHLVEEWEQLDSHAKLADARYNEESQLVLTTTDDIRLHCEDRPDTRWLGAFQITIGLDDGSIHLVNLNTRRGGRDHPHVVDGNPCFGGNHQAFAQLLSNGDLFVLFEMLVQYLETLNLQDEYGQFGAYWFEQEDQRPLEVAAA